LAVIADNRGAILDLAARQIPTDPIMRRLQSFINLQFFDCMWGMVPGSAGFPLSVRQPELSEIFCHTVQGGGGKDHCLLEF
jgi:hypothetical protein